MKNRAACRSAGIAFCIVTLCGAAAPQIVRAQQEEEVAQQQEQAQDQPRGTQSDPAPAAKGSAAGQDKKSPNGTSNDRLFYALPNFLTLETGARLPPLTAKQKFAVVARSAFDYVEYPWYGFQAGISQAENSEPGYGQGAEGYGKRYGAAFADGTIENFMTGAVLPSILKEDPRFYQSSSGGFVHRTLYAASRIFITRTDAGGKSVNYSEILGSGVAAGISTYSYHPQSDRTFPNTVSVWGTQVGYDTLTIVVKEFWPDIRRKLSREKQTETAVPQT
jgi:hypothetical protein